MERIIKKNPLYFAFLFPALTDGVTTLVGQGSQYWSSKVVNEASPAYYFLLASPWLFIFGSIVWYIGWYLIFKKLREPFNLLLMFLFISGHSWGSTSWIFNMLKRVGVYRIGDQPSIIFAWSLAIIYFLLIATIATYCLRLYIKVQKR